MAKRQGQQSLVSVTNDLDFASIVKEFIHATDERVRYFGNF